MNETDAWNSFLMSGSVVDYLRYKAIQHAKQSQDPQENKNEIQEQRIDNKGTEHR